MNKVVKYIRISSKNQDLELKEQQEKLKQYTKERGYEVAEVGAVYKQAEEIGTLKGIFADEGNYTRDILEHQKAFIKMLDKAKQGKFNEILMENTNVLVKLVTDGILRGTGNAMEIIQILRKQDVNVHFIRENIDTIEPSNDFVLTIMFYMSEIEIIERKKRAKRKLK